jgi:hypothetical protein
MLSFLNERTLTEQNPCTKETLAKDPGHVTTLCNFGFFLQTVRKDNEGAKAKYEAVLAKDPDHPSTLYGFAYLLFVCLSRTPANVYTALDLLERRLRLDPDLEGTEDVSTLHDEVLAYIQKNAPVFKRF